MTRKILIVDDEWNMRNLVKIYLYKEGFQLEEAGDGREAIDMFHSGSYDLIVLDIMLPDMDGWEVCETIRKTSQIPILMLTARDDVQDRVRGLSIGADDYLVKPFAPEEMVARIQALLRRQPNEAHPRGNHFLEFPNLSINRESREARVNGNLVDLTPKEFEILFLTASQPKRVFTREILLDSIWAMNEFRDTRAADSHIKNIREKLRTAGLPYNPLKTVWGVGYKFNVPEDQSANE